MAAVDEFGRVLGDLVHDTFQEPAMLRRGISD
jgi:hypothetical protein